eukprot:m.152064 g.152064  ORF g.152064 m.152064 type:complete len:241 (-) comp17882_c0_seq5:371-1093(-)
MFSSKLASTDQLVFHVKMNVLTSSHQRLARLTRTMPKSSGRPKELRASKDRHASQTATAQVLPPRSKRWQARSAGEVAPTHLPPVPATEALDEVEAAHEDCDVGMADTVEAAPQDSEQTTGNSAEGSVVTRTLEAVPTVAVVGEANADRKSTPNPAKLLPSRKHEETDPGSKDLKRKRDKKLGTKTDTVIERIGRGGVVKRARVAFTRQIESSTQGQVSKRCNISDCTAQGLVRSGAINI